MSIVQRSVLLAVIVTLASCGQPDSTVVAEASGVEDEGSKVAQLVTSVAVPIGPPVVFPRASIERLEGGAGRVCAFIDYSDPPPCREILRIVDVGDVDFSDADELGRLHNVRVEGVLVDGQINSVAVTSALLSAVAYAASECNPGSGIGPTVELEWEPRVAGVPVAHTPWAVYPDAGSVVIAAPLSDAASRGAWCDRGYKLEIRSYGSILD